MPQYRLQGREIGHWTLLRLAQAATFVLLIVSTGTAARAGDDDSDSSNASIYDRILQVIGVNGGANIQYSERSPLVVPPTRDLPPPQAAAPPPVADWPHDPDIARRAQAKVREKPRPHDDYVIESSRPLRPDELRASGVPAGRGGGAAAPGTEESAPRPKKSIFSLDFFKKEEYATFTGEPARTSLTDPPPGYMTPSPDEPYGIGPDRKKYKIPTVGDRMTPLSGSSGSN